MCWALDSSDTSTTPSPRDLVSPSGIPKGVFFNGILSPPVQPVNCGVVMVRQGPISSAACQAFCSFISDGRWKWRTEHMQDRTSWVALAVEFVGLI